MKKLLIVIIWMSLCSWVNAESANHSLKAKIRENDFTVYLGNELRFTVEITNDSEETFTLVPDPSDLVIKDASGKSFPIYKIKTYHKPFRSRVQTLKEKAEGGLMLLGPLRRIPDDMDPPYKSAEELPGHYLWRPQYRGSQYACYLKPGTYNVQFKYKKEQQEYYNEEGEQLSDELWIGELESSTIQFNILGPNNDDNDIAKEYYEDGTLKREVPYENGLKHGTFREYYPNGNLKHLFKYVDGILKGIGESYYEDGELLMEIVFKDNSAHETTDQHQITKYYKSGAIKSVRTKFWIDLYHFPYNLNFANINSFTSDDMIKQYYENGQLEFEQNPYSYDCKETRGVIKRFYYENGQLSRESACMDKEGEIITKEFYESGALKMEEREVYSELDGEQKYFDENGDLKYSFMYREGLLLDENGNLKNGIVRIYDDQKEKLEKVIFKGGLPVD